MDKRDITAKIIYDDKWDAYFCSVCGQEIDGYGNYCMWCGAKLKQEDDDEDYTGD